MQREDRISYANCIRVLVLFCLRYIYTELGLYALLKPALLSQAISGYVFSVYVKCVYVKCVCVCMCEMWPSPPGFVGLFDSCEARVLFAFTCHVDAAAL